MVCVPQTNDGEMPGGPLRLIGDTPGATCCRKAATGCCSGFQVRYCCCCSSCCCLISVITGSCSSTPIILPPNTKTTPTWCALLAISPRAGSEVDGLPLQRLALEGLLEHVAHHVCADVCIPQVCEPCCPVEWACRWLAHCRCVCRALESCYCCVHSDQAVEK